MSTDRFPGLRPFEEKDAAIFNGREREIQMLFDLIMVERTAVVFAKSGAGKTSLLRAGLAPKLEPLPYEATFIRLNRPGSPLEQTRSQLAEAFGISAAPGQTLWEYLKTINEYTGSRTPILIFDQFEELFTLCEQTTEREAFMLELGDVINCSLPKSLQERMAGSQAQIGDARLAEMERPPRVKALFSIRSDMLSFLHEASEHIPGILRNRFELKGLKPDQARKAILAPAGAPGDFDCPPFSVSEAAQNDIIDYLKTKQTGRKNEDDEIESFQLQLVCSHLEAQMKALHNRGVSPLTVQIDTYGGPKGIEQLLSRFYQNTLSAVSSKTERDKTRRIVEEELIKNERRVSVAEASIVRSAKQPLRPETLRLLVDRRLLRREERPNLGNYYELTHDTLLRPVLAARAERKAAERIQQVLFWAFVAALCAMIGFLGFVYMRNKNRQTQARFLMAESRLQAGQDRTLAFRLAEAAYYLDPGNMDANSAMVGAYYSNFIALDDTLYTPHYREYEALLSKLAGAGAAALCLPEHRASELRLIHPASGKTDTFRMKAFEGPGIVYADISPDLQRIVTVHYEDSTARLWDRSGQLLQSLAHKGFVLSAAFSPDGRFLSTNAEDRTQRLWAAADGAPVAVWPNESRIDLPRQTAFSPDGRYLLATEKDDQLAIYELPAARKKYTWQLDPNAGGIELARFARDGRSIAAITRNEESGGAYLQRFSLDQGRQAGKALEGEWTDILPLKGDTVWTADGKGNISLFAAGKKLRGIDEKGHEKHNSGVIKINADPSGRFLASIDRERNAKLWDVNNGHLANFQHEASLRNVYFTSDGRYLITNSAASVNTGKLRIWALKDTPLRQIKTNDIPLQALFEPGARRIIAHDFSDQWYYADTEGGLLTPPRWLNDSLDQVFPWGDGQHLYLLYKDRRQFIRHAANERMYPLENLPEGASQAVWSARSDVYGWVKKDSIFAWNSSGENLLSGLYFTDQRSVYRIAISPDGKKIAICTEKDTISPSSNASKLWNVMEWDIAAHKLNDLQVTSSDRVRQITYAPDSRSIVFATEKGVFSRWDKDRALDEYLLRGHRYEAVISDIRYSPDGHYIATASKAPESAAILWDDKGHLVNRFDLAAFNSVNGVDFSSDGKYLLVKSQKNRIFILPLEPELLIRTLDAQGVRQLSPAEKRQYSF